MYVCMYVLLQYPATGIHAYVPVHYYHGTEVLKLASRIPQLAATAEALRSRRLPRLRVDSRATAVLRAMKENPTTRPPFKTTVRCRHLPGIRKQWIN